MQQSGAALCVGGANDNLRCLRNADCPAEATGPAGTCQLVLMSELDVDGNHDLVQGTGGPCPVATPMCMDEAWCRASWNETTRQYERSLQSAFHNGQSDWETLVENYPFLHAPSGLPLEAAPATCYRRVVYRELVTGSDQVIMLLDKSGSMAFSSDPRQREICGNRSDDDADGATDEAACAEPRMTFVRDAANAYLDLQRDSGVDVGLVTFNETNWPDVPLRPLDALNIEISQRIVNRLSPSGATAIGDALDATRAQFELSAMLGRSRTAYLLTDGYNTAGGSPAAAAERLRDIGVTVHVVPAGSDFNGAELSGLAARTGGSMFPAPAMSDLIGVYAELAALQRGSSLLVQRTNFELSPTNGPGIPGGPNTTPEVREFSLPVESGAKRLTAFVAGRNARMSEWQVGFELRGPRGEIFRPGSAELTVRPHYIFARVNNPASGAWKLVVTGRMPFVQKATVLAFAENPLPDFFVDVTPRALEHGARARITANPIYGVSLDPKNVEVRGQLVAPSGRRTAIALTADASGTWSARTAALTEAGAYTVEMQTNVSTGAQTLAGEPIFSGAARYPAVVPAFQRAATASFTVAGKKFPCLGSATYDCDQDGIVDARECPQTPDLDGDGRPNGFDPDADGDEIPTPSRATSMQTAMGSRTCVSADPRVRSDELPTAVGPCTSGPAATRCDSPNTQLTNLSDASAT